jgi:hypothetical protein
MLFLALLLGTNQHEIENHPHKKKREQRR